MAAITIYDGAETIGGNKIYVEENGRGVFLDFGMNFARRNAYFDDFLSERSGRGIHDLVSLGMIPPINIYRQDLVPADMDGLVSGFPKINVEAVLLSHAHVDHNGNIGLLDPAIPVVASATSVAIMKAMRDIGQADVAQEVAYMSVRKRDNTGLYLSADSKVPYRGRDFCCPDGCPAELGEFLSRRPGGDSGRAKSFDGCGLSGIDGLELPFEVKTFNVNHSIYGALAYTLKGEGASIAYTGDFRIGDNAKEMPDFIKEARSSDVLIIEGTRTGREGDVEVTESTVHDTCRATAEDVKGLIIADFGARNFERLEIFRRIAQETGRQLVITAKDAYGLYAIECADGACRMNDVLVYDEIKDKTKSKYETDTLARQCPITYVSHLDIKNNPGNYILCFSFFDMKQLLDIEPEGGAYIYSACEAFSEEQEIDFGKLKNWLDHFDIKPYGFSYGENGLEFDKEYHASGHASREELARVIDAVDPDVLIPVHTENHDWFIEKWEQTRQMTNGERFNL
ncbi:MAG TPA: MBL fold metallo-hydrolase RNA specificity domain-containing protein [Methanocella sp.]|uniref:MBL fold metallo-hydrolase RNA specificity domain-containing protein n=1 Tax=Methanocella sp. TaxID=2052833 RepID=UPI002BAD5E13|nr:MBL fold metallo-hydrolase RNA specificity domain-containing protein [Methanocella sp.]HTY91417.1 MBL fold metallo-hydrolase RNA specificity domain-containing protein [Methanocella sp.]